MIELFWTELLSKKNSPLDGQTILTASQFAQWPALVETPGPYKYDAISSLNVDWLTWLQTFRWVESKGRGSSDGLWALPSSLNCDAFHVEQQEHADQKEEITYPWQN